MKEALDMIAYLLKACTEKDRQIIQLGEALKQLEVRLEKQKK